MDGSNLLELFHMSIWGKSPWKIFIKGRPLLKYLEGDWTNLAASILVGGERVDVRHLLLANHDVLTIKGTLFIPVCKFQMSTDKCVVHRHQELHEINKQIQVLKNNKQCATLFN